MQPGPPCPAPRPVATPLTATSNSGRPSAATSASVASGSNEWGPRKRAAALREVLVDRRGDFTYCLDISVGSGTASDQLIAPSGIRDGYLTGSGERRPTGPFNAPPAVTSWCWAETSALHSLSPSPSPTVCVSPRPWITGSEGCGGPRTRVTRDAQRGGLAFVQLEDGSVCRCPYKTCGTCTRSRAATRRSPQPCRGPRRAW